MQEAAEGRRTVEEGRGMLLFFQPCRAGHGEKMKIRASVITVKIRHEPGEGMAPEAAAFIKLVQIGEKAARIVLRHS